MTGWAPVSLVGISTLAGAGLGGGIGWWLGRYRRDETASVIDLDTGREVTNEHERQQIAADFGVHAASIRQQVSLYADQLADGDPVLRARLRLFEQRASQ